MNNETTVFKVSLDDSGSIKTKTNEMKAFNAEGSKAAKMAAAKVESRTYGQARAGSGTGAAGRDFAKESQGLGGLVRVYATFAANIFAVSAAYTALSNAVDTANLVKGLDQLGAASGKNLGTLSKRIVEVTDNAVSMREAMTATAQASSAGMSSVEILKMAKGAKQASQALGIDMANALSRLSRGIVKLEPELLDELGIFVRVDKASQDYAKSLGKSVMALTDVEKRAGFTKAVLDQLEKKFSGIDIPTNPYTQLLASLKNVTQGGLELINTVLGPIVRLLAQSPTGLAVALAGVAGILIKQAVPALGAWRDNLNNLAKSSKETSERINTQFAEYQVKQSEKHGDELAKRIEKEKSAAATSLGIAKGAVSESGLKKGKIFDLIQNIPKTKEAEEAANKLLTSQISGYETRRKNLAATDAAASKAAADRVVALEKLKAALPGLIQSERELVAARAKAEESMYAAPMKGSEAWQREKIAKDARTRAGKAEVLGNVAANTQVMGIAGAWSETKADIAKQGLKGLDAGVTKVRAGFAIATSAIGTFANALSGVFMIVGLVVTGVTLLVSALRSNAEKAAETATAITALDESAKGAARTFEYWSKRDPLEQLSASGISAKAAAIDEIAVAVKDAMDKAEKEIAGRNWMDSTVNWFAKLIGKDTETELAGSIAKGVVEAVKLAGSVPGTEGAIQKLQLSAGTASTNVREVADTLKKLPKEQLNAVVISSQNLSKVTKTLSSDVSSLKNSYDGLVKKISEYVTETTKLDTMGEIGQGMTASALSLATALENPLTSIAELNNLLKDNAKLALFPTEFVNKLAKLAPEFDNTATSIAGNITGINDLTIKLKALEQEYDSINKVENVGAKLPAGIQYTVDALKSQINDLKTNIAELNKANTSQVKGTSNTFNVLKDAVISQFTAGAKITEASINSGFVKAGITLTKAYSGLLSGTVGGEQLANKAAKQEIQLQIEAILVQVDLIRAVERAAIASDTLALAMKEANLLNRPKGEGGVGRGDQEREIADLRSSISGRRILTENKDPYGVVAKAVKTALVSGDTGEVARLKALLEPAAKLSKMNSRVAELQASSKAVDIGSQGQVLDRAAKSANQILDDRTELLAAERKLLELQKASGNITQLEAVTRSSVLDDTERELKLQKEMNVQQLITDKALKTPVQTQVEKGTGKTIPLIGSEWEAAVKTVNEAQAEMRRLSLKAFEAVPGQQTTAIYEMGKAARADQLKLEDFNIKTATDAKERALDLEAVKSTIVSDELENMRSLGKLSEDEYTRQKALSDIQKLNVEYAKSKFAVESASAAKLLQIGRERTEALSFGPTDTQSFEDRTKAEETAAKQLLDTLKLGYDSRLKGVQVMSQGSERLLAYTDLFKQGFKGMEDAIVEFTKTGKLSFKGMIDSFIEGLLRFQIQKAQTAVFGQAGDLATSFIGKLFGGNQSGVSGVTAGSQQDTMLAAQTAGMFQAKGGAWDTGVQAFAKGGMFTNSIVSSPTLFKFAKGTGMMGEAGPEAIMPLKRDANGNLGVRSGESSAKVDVVVNNYSTAPATAKETTDSRGNRKIEVTIGDMVAQEVSRTGSSLQQAMTSTYGNRPALARR